MPTREIQHRKDSQLFAQLCLALLREGHSVRFRVQGESMRPNILDGDAVVVAPAPAGDLRQGDIALVQNQDGLRVHRVETCGASSGAVVTRSDAGLDSDPAASRLFGKIVVLRRNSREESLTPLRTRLIHPLRVMFRRLRAAAMLRLRRAALLVSGVFALALLCAGFLAPAALAQADLQLTQTASSATIPVSTSYTYSEVVTNNGPSAVTNATDSIVVYMQTPANTKYQASAGTNWTCVNGTGGTPAIGYTGPLICTYAANLAVNASTSTLTITMQVNAATAAGTTVLSSATVTSDTLKDPKPANNTSITSIYVEPTGSADVALSMSVFPTPVFVSSSITYTISVQNIGPASATGVTVTDTLPASLNFGTATPSQGTCSGGLSLNCALGTIAATGTATISVTLTTPPSATTLTNTATVATSSTDSNANNNSATVYTVVQPISCANPGRDGAGGILTGIVNTYFPGTTATLGAGSNSVTLGAAAAGGAQTPIAAGDLLLIIQMQDATINSTNTSSYGDGLAGDPGSGSTSLGSSGLFEFITATSAVRVTGGTLTFTGTGSSGGLLNSYYHLAASSTGTTYVAQQTYQVIRVPQYSSATLNYGVVAPALSWNGSVGGVLVIDASSQLTLAGTVALDALGFRGGGAQMLTGPATAGAVTDYVTVAPTSNTTTTGVNGSKGEGIAGTPRYVPPTTITTASVPTDAYGGALTDSLPGGSSARGAPGNAGGGGTDGAPGSNADNSGGGAGGNGGTGGQGGYGWDSMAATNSTDGGFGGVAFPASTSALVMGGGGGAGTTNNGTWCNYSTATSSCTTSGTTGTGIYSSGGAGGGIAIIHAGSVSGTGTITSNGQSTLSTLNDSTGGGGAGGSIIVFANSGTLSGLTVNAIGGNGGYSWPIEAPGTPFYSTNNQRHGPGGGGGGGVIFLSAAPAAYSVAGGVNGYTDSVQDSFGATVGQTGLYANTHVITETPGTQPGAYCATADLSVTNVAAPLVVTPGGTITFTQVVANNGPLDAVNAVFTQGVPANTAVYSITPPAGWTCATTAGTISCTPTSGVFPVNATGVTFSVVVTVAAGTTTGTQIVDTASITSGTADPNPTNNTATAISTVGGTGTSDLAISDTASPSSVLAGSDVTLTGIITNRGPSAAASPVFTEAVPPNTTYVSVSGPAGWSCYPPVSGIVECVDNSALAVNSFATITVVVNVPGATTPGTVFTATDNVNSATVDPNYSNNSASTSFTVVATGQADLAVAASASPDPVFIGNNITFSETVTNNGPSTITASATTSVSFTVAIPANTTLVSLTPPSTWTCNNVSGTYTCYLNTNQSIAVGSPNAVSFPLVVSVNSTTAPGTVISITPTVASTSTSGATDPNPSNNTATASTVVATPTQATLSITKAASPEPVDQNSNLTYIIIVTNAGPAAAKGVQVTDTIPSDVTYSSYSTSLATSGVCTYVSPTLTCTLGTVSVGGTVTVIINVTAGQPNTSTSVTCNGLSVTVCNTATVTTTTSNASPSTSASAGSTIQYSTAVDISSFHAFSQSDGSVVLEWRTQAEYRNLGFHVYREDASGRTRLDPSLIAGSALLLRGARPQHAAKIYRWIDPHPVRDAAYWIEDVDISGARGPHGPAYVESPSAEVAATLASARSSALLSSQRTSSLAPPTSANPSPAMRILQPGLPIPPPGFPPLNVADHQAVKISVAQEGWYHVSFAQLFAAGLDPYTDSRTLHLYAEGVEQPLLLAGRASGPPSPSDAIEFYGMGIDTPFSADRVYWLISDYHSPKRILTVPAPVSGGTPPASFPFTVLREDRTIYFAALLNGENNDNFFGAIISSEPTDQDLVVAHSDPSSALPISVDVALQGASDAQEHSVTVQFNGATIGEMDFYGMVLAQQSFPVEPSLLQNGTNTLTLTALNGDNDVSLVQAIALHYAHTYVADADWLRATAPAGSELHLTGFSNPQIRVFDITDPLNISELATKITPEPGAYGASLALSTGGPAVRTILAFANDAISAAASLAPHLPTFLDDQHIGADVVIITHPDFVGRLAPLVRLRESQGHHVSVVTTDQIFDEYNFGERSPFAIRSFLRQAASVWQRKPQSILLVGDASFDPRGYLGLGDFDFVPTRIIETAAFKTASDDWFTDFAQNGFATIPTGRLPVRTPADADLVVSKIIGYETRSSAGSWNSQALLIADQNSDSNFTTAAASAAATLPTTLQVSEIFAGSLDTPTARSQILAALNNGALLVDYSGHGAEQQWSFADLFDTNDAAALSNGGRLPVYLLMDCLNGFFQDAYAESLAESLLLAPNGGAVAVWASSGFTQQPPQSTLNQAFLHVFAANPNQSLGRLVLQAKAGTTDNDVRRTWILFGDPAMKVQLVPVAIPASTPASKSQPVAAPVSNRPCLPESVCLKEKQRQ